MRLFETAALTAAAVNFTLACFVYRQNKRLALHRAYLVWGIGVALWNLSCFFLYQEIPADQALIWMKILQFGIIIAPIGLLETSQLIAERPLARWVRWSIYGLHTTFIVSLATPYFISGVRQIPYGYWSIPGPLFWVYSISYAALTIRSIVVLYQAQRNSARLKRKRVRTMLIAVACIWLAGSNDFLPILGIDYYPFTDKPFYPLGNMAACIYMTIVAYSVLQFSLLDVHVALSRFAAHIVRILLISLIGLCLLLLLTAVAPDQFSSFAFYGSLGAMLASAILASILFPKLLGGSGESFERRLLGDRFEYQDQVRDFIHNMTWYTDLNVLLDEVHELFTRTFKLAGYQIILRDETNHVFGLTRAHPEQPPRQFPEFKPQSPIIQFFEWGKGEYLSLRSVFLRPGESPLEKQARAQLAPFHAEFCLPFVTESEPFGLLLVGEKVNGEPYTATDINLLVALVKNMSLMVNQIRLKTQILQAQELDLLGRMSRGMAHDLNNLLTPVWTLLQLTSEDETRTIDEELLPVALRNLRTMRAYIKEALFFSENLRPDFQLGRLDVLVMQAVEVARNSRKKQVIIEANTPGEVLVEMDEVLVQRMVANIISNAIDASVPGGAVEVELIRLVKTESSRDWLRIRISDHGEGIRREDLDRVFTPYFTTKNRGDEARGFGLGLAICRKIVNLHGGNLSIASQIKKGTTVQVDLPNRQARAHVPQVATPA